MPRMSRQDRLDHQELNRELANLKSSTTPVAYYVPFAAIAAGAPAWLYHAIRHISAVDNVVVYSIVTAISLVLLILAYKNTAQQSRERQHKNGAGQAINEKEVRGLAIHYVNALYFFSLMLVHTAVTGEWSGLYWGYAFPALTTAGLTYLFTTG